MLQRNIGVLVGIAFGIILMLAFYFFTQFRQQRSLDTDELKYNVNTGTKIDTIQDGKYKIEIKEHNEVQIKEQNEVIEEKLKSLNDRIGDLYLSMTIIVTLVLVIVASVYLKAGEEVAKHMNKHFGQYRSEIEAMNAQAQQYLTEIRTKAELAEQVSIKQQTNQSNAPGQESNQPIQPETDNNQNN